MVVLGLDTSTTSTGYAILDNDKIICSGVIKPNKKLDLLDKIIYIEREIKELIKQKEVEFIVIEELVMFRGSAVIRALAGLIYHLLVEFRKQEYLCVAVRPTEWRKGKIKGKGRLELKESAVIYVKEKYNIIVNDDEAEAILIRRVWTRIGD